MKGATHLIKLARPVIMVELNGLAARYGSNDNDVVDYLIRLGYNQVARENKDVLFKHGKC